MPHQIDILSSVRPLPKGARSAIRRAANAALAEAGVASEIAVSILLTDDDSIRELNRQFRQEDRPTDVLSFAAGQFAPEVNGLPIPLGDIAISLPTAERQADAKDHDVVAELQLLAIHGVLHLAGYNHDDAAEKEAMWVRQSAALKRLGLEGIAPTEDEHED